MMKQLFLLFAMGCCLSLSAQDLLTAAPQTAPTGKFSALLHKFSLTATAGTGGIHQ